MSDFPNRGFYRGNYEAMLRDVERGRNKVLLEGGLHEIPKPTTSRGEVPPEVEASPATSIGETLSSREAARGSGYTGDQCTNCNSLRMKVSGHCMVCEDCGTTTGCS